MIQRAKKPAIIATTAATPPFATTEWPAAVEEAAGEAVGVVVPDVGDAEEPPGVVVPLAEPLVAAPEVAVPVAALDPGEVNETAWGVADGPVTERPAEEEGRREKKFKIVHQREKTKKERTGRTFFTL